MNLEMLPPLPFWGQFGKARYQLSLYGRILSVKSSVWFWSFVFWEFFDGKFSFTTIDLSVPIVYFFLIQSQKIMCFQGFYPFILGCPICCCMIFCISLIIGFIISSFISYFESSLFFLMSLDKDINFILKKKKKKAKNARSCFH